MASKKSPATRQTNAARRPQTTAKVAPVRLVRPDGTSVGSVSAGTPVVTRPTHAQPARPAPAVRYAGKPSARSTATATRPTASATKAAPAPADSARAQVDRTQMTKVARAREMQRAHAANRITPEHYSYVKNDLRLIAVLATCMFAVIIALHFVLG